MSAIAPISDAELLKRYEKGKNETAFRALVERYQAMVLGAAFRRTGNLELAREVTQEVFATLAKKARFLTDRASIGGWLHQAAVYQAARTAQSEARRHARQEHFAKEVPTVATPVVGGSTGPDQLSVVDEALGFLSGADQEVIILHYFQDLSYPEMASLLGLNEAAVRQRVSRALERLGKRLREQGVNGSVGVLILGAVAVQSSLAAPAGLATAALATAAAGGGYSAYLLLTALLTKGAIKTAAVLVGVAGMTALWHETDFPNLSMRENVQLPAVHGSGEDEVSGDSVRVKTDRLPADAPSAGQRRVFAGNMTPPGPVSGGIVRQAPEQSAQPRVAPSSSRFAAPSNLPVLATLDPPKGGTPLPVVKNKPPQTGNTPPKIVSASPEESRSLDPLSDALPSLPDYRLPGVLGELAEVGGLPAVIAELRDVELLPREAAKLYGELLEDVLVLEPGKRPLLEGFLENHYEQLNEQGIAGIRVPEIADESRRVLREASVNEVVDGVQTILSDVAPDPEVIEDVFALVERPDSEADSSEPATLIDEVADIVPVLPKVTVPVKLPLLN